jgi:hypothetical protein
MQMARPVNSRPADLLRPMEAALHDLRAAVELDHAFGHAVSAAGSLSVPAREGSCHPTFALCSESVEVVSPSSVSRALSSAMAEGREPTRESRSPLRVLAEGLEGLGLRKPMMHLAESKQTGSTPQHNLKQLPLPHHLQLPSRRRCQSKCQAAAAWLLAVRQVRVETLPSPSP